MSKARVLSGVRVTHKLHIGNYWGAVRNWLHLQNTNQYECFFGVMDWHGLTTAYKSSAETWSYSKDIFADLIAWGLDPSKVTLFIQSHVPEHLELFMIFANLTPLGWLERVPTWKDAEEEAKQNDTHNLGRFAYPVLQAADIAIYRGQLVPVGADQVAHLELSREIIRRFNHLYKSDLPEMKPLLTETPLVSGLDGRKMSKSYNNTLFLTEDSEKALQKKVNSMVTDPQRVRREDKGNPDVCTVYGYHKFYSTSQDLDWVVSGCRSAGIGCGDCKKKLTENIEAITRGPREIKKELLADSSKLNHLIHEGSSKAREEAQKSLKKIRQDMKWGFE